MHEDDDLAELKPFDREFEERLRPWREYAEELGLDVGAFDARIATRKQRVDVFRAAAGLK